MSNKKRISKRVNIIHNKAKWKHFSYLCLWMESCIEKAIYMRKILYHSRPYPAGRVIATTNAEPEKILDSNGDEWNLYFSNSQNIEQS